MPGFRGDQRQTAVLEAGLVLAFASPSQMSHYPNYPLPTPGQQPAQAAYPYTYYPGAHSQHPQAPGATPYPSGYPSNYPTGVSGYGAWPGYAYSYPSPHYRTTAGGTAAPAPPQATAPTPTRTTTFSTNYTPAYMKDTVAAAASGGAAANRRKQLNHRGAFTKECKIHLDQQNPTIIFD